MRPWRASDAEQQFVGAGVERRQAQPLIYIGRGRVVRQRTGEIFEQHRLDAAEPAAFGGDPGVEHRAARDLEAFEQLAGEQRGQLLLPLDA